MRLFLPLAALLAAIPVLADEAIHTFHTSLPRGNVHRVVVELPAGEVTIRNGAGDRISLSGTSKRHFHDENLRAKEQAIADDISAEVVIRGEEAVVRRRFGPAAQSWSARGYHSGVELTIDLPPGVDLEVGTRYGSVDIDGAFGRIDTDLRAGEVHLRTPRANVRDLSASVTIGEVHTYFGDHYIENEGVFPRVARFHNEQGRADVNVRSTVGEVHVTLTQ